MAGNRKIIVAEMAVAAVWTWVALKVVPGWLDLADRSFVETALTVFLAPGLVLAAMVLTVGLHRFLGLDALEGGSFRGQHAAINQRVLINTTEQLVLGVTIWPAAAYHLGDQGPGVLTAMSLSFVVARIFFWIGYHIRPELRAFGFAATFYPTVVLGIWGLVRALGA